MEDTLFFTTLITTLLLAIAAGFNGNYYTLLAILFPGTVYLWFTKGFFFFFPLTMLPFLALLAFTLLAWRTPFFTPKVWTRFTYIISAVAPLAILFFLIIPRYSLPNFGYTKQTSLLGIVLTSIGSLIVAFGCTKMFIVDVLQILINQIKTVSRTTITGRFTKVQSSTENRNVIYFLTLENSSEKIRINLLTVLYLNLFAKGKIIEFTFKRGFLGIEYCNRFPKLIDAKTDFGRNTVF